MRLDEKISRFQAAWLADSHKTHGLPWASIPRCFHGVIATINGRKKWVTGVVTPISGVKKHVITLL